MPVGSNLLVCGRCGAPLRGLGPDGLCASCLLDSAFERPAGDPGTTDHSGTVPRLAFGDYAVLGEIARGGMGVIYRARQVSLNRNVALKMILGGHFATGPELERFRAEAATAAQLQHPNIVAIHEVGEHAGQPFFSMDLVDGRDLAQLTRDESISPRQAAGYLRTIAEAVHYAHSRGVLHRDLKPSNILIDAHGQPRITDFGLAKRLTETTGPEDGGQLTRTGQVLGSPSFISPEQAAGEKARMSPASDIYSLGAVLYHLLTGRPPFAGETLTQTLRMVAEMDPVPPRLLNAAVPRDLETICLKCLEKEPRRRYATAQELADELGRFLDQKPIRARPAGALLKLHRWCLRNKPLAIAGTAIVALLLIVAIGALIAAFRIEGERRQAEANAATAQASRDLLLSMITTVTPETIRNADTTARLELLDKTAEGIGQHLAGQPRLEADIRLILGSTYVDLGLYTNALAMTQEALRLRREVFGPKDVAVADALSNLGAILYSLGEIDAAEAKDREALAIRRELLPAGHLDIATSLNNLGLRLWQRGRFADAEAMHREALGIRTNAHGAVHPDVGKSLNNLAMVLWAVGRFEEAGAAFRHALEVFKRALPEDHPVTVTIENNVSTVLRDLGDLDGAEGMAREVLARRERILPEGHSDIAYSRNNLAIVLQRKGQWAEAEDFHQKALAAQRVSLGSNHIYVAETLSAFAVVLGKRGDLAAAETMQREAQAVAERSLGKNNAATVEVVNRLALLRALRGDPEEAGRMLTNALAIARTAFGADHADTIPLLVHLSWVLHQRGEATAAGSLWDQAVALSRPAGPYGLRALTEATYDLVDTLCAVGRCAEAEPLLLRVLEPVDQQAGNNEYFRRAATARVARLQELRDRVVPDARPGR